MTEEKSKKIISEVNVILNQMEEESLKKIPKKLLEQLAENAIYDVEYIKPDIPLENLPLETETKSILAIISYNYFCNDEEKKQWQKIMNMNEKKYLEEQRKKYSIDIFKSEKKLEEKDNNISENLQLMEYKEEGILKKIINRIKKYLKR